MDWNEIWSKVSDVLLNGGWMLLKLIGIFIVGYILIRIIKRIVGKFLEKSIIDQLAKKFIKKTCSFILYFMLLLILIQTAGIQISGIIAALAAAGLAIALALKDSLSSLANGVMLIITKPFKENDSVEIDGISGKVKEIRFFNTIIDTWDNKRVIIPNKNVVNYQIVNNNFHPIRRFSIDFKVSANTDFKKLKEMLLTAILSNKNVFTDPAPAVLLKEIGDEGLRVEARGWAKSGDVESVMCEVRETILNELKRNNIDTKIKKLVVKLDDKKENVEFDSTPLPERDMSENPEVKIVETQTFESYIANRTRQNLQKLKIKKNKKKKKKQENQEE